MSPVLVALQLGVLALSLGLVFWQWRTRSQPETRSIWRDCYDLELSQEPLKLGEVGTLQLNTQLHNGCLPDGALSLSADLDGVQIIEVWAGVEAGWIQLVPAGTERWRSPLLRNHPLLRLRIWVSPEGQPDHTALIQAAPMLLQATALLSNQDPLGTPVSDPASSLAAWIAHQRGDVLVAALLEEWTQAVTEAGAMGWAMALPVGESLLDTWAEKATPSADPGAVFARWFLGRIGLASRRGLDSRQVAELRDPLARKVMRAAARLIRGLDERLEVKAQCPRAVGPKHRDLWLVDTQVAAQIENPIVAGLVQPILVLRPALVCEGVVLLEGEVA